MGLAPLSVCVLMEVSLYFDHPRVRRPAPVTRSALYLQLERATRHRNLASLELFLSCAQKQLSSLMLDGTIEGEGSPDTPASSPSL